MRSVPAGDHDYERQLEYRSRRRTDPRIETLVHEALDDAKTVVNVGT